MLNLVVPQLAKVALTFSQPEYFALAVTALTLIASLGSRGMKKAAISGAFGLLAATIGIDPMTSDARFTFEGDGSRGRVFNRLNLQWAPKKRANFNYYEFLRHLSIFFSRPIFLIFMVAVILAYLTPVIRWALKGFRRGHVDITSSET